MSEKKHTPGPWHISDDSKGSKFRVNWRRIEPSVVTPDEFSTTRGSESWTTSGVEISEEDARLIVAAPELLSALLEMERWMTEDSSCKTEEQRHKGRLALIAARVIILKATGDGK